MVKKVLITNTGNISSLIAMANMKSDNNPVVVGVDLAKGEDCGVEFKGHYEDDKFVITDLKYLNVRSEKNAED